ncbi:MAG: hypothetical protein IJR91_08610 [Ruminococcus sp.]|nr:hypothetical protein [Ruminococcus sp.]
MSKNRKKHQKPAEAVFDDQKDLELERMGGTGSDVPDTYTGLDSGAASAGEMTGISPSGGNMTDGEYDELKDIFPFGQTNFLPR